MTESFDVIEPTFIDNVMVVEGPPGTNGNTILGGAGAPANDLGGPGDWYLRTSNWDVYFKTGPATWVVQGNIKGAVGTAGRGITSIALIAGDHSPGTSDTYRITFTDATTYDYSVYNGADGEVSEAELTAAVAALVDAAPGTLDTLNELAAALGDDPNFAATMTTALSGKLATSAAPELIRDTIGTALLQGRNVTITVDDAGDTITIKGKDAYVTGLATTGTVTIDAANGEGVYESATLTGNITLAFSNLPAGESFICEYRSVQHASAAKTITMPSGTAMTAMTTPPVGKAFSIFAEYVNGAALRYWLTTQP
jgi:hypothetical protein